MEVTKVGVPQFVMELGHSSQAGEIRRAAVAYAERMGLNETERGTVAIVATEMATNVLKHAKQGLMVCQGLGYNGWSGLRLISLDRGPGIRNLHAAMEDGYSTAGSPGSGLGSLRRLSSRLEIFTLPGRGTCVAAEFWPKGQRDQDRTRVEVGAICLPIRGEEVCGDAWTVKRIPDGLIILVVDGLGHGILAAEAANEAVRIVEESQSISPLALLQDCHDALKKTRGAAVAIAAIDQRKQTLSFAGLGNISGSILTPQSSRGLTSHNGTVGHQMHRSQEFTLPWTQESLLIMHSDGLGSRWNLSDYPGLWTREANTIAAVLYRDFTRGRDDTTVLVGKSGAWQ